MDYRNPADKSDESSSSGSTEYTDSSEDDASANYVFYRDRPEWKDVQPIVQDDGDVNIVRIAYTEKCKRYKQLSLYKTVKSICLTVFLPSKPTLKYIGKQYAF